MKFDPEIWKAEAGNDLAANNRRADMVRDLRENVIKVGMSRVEIHNLLGAPDIQKATRDTYALGKAAYSPDFEYFVIEYSDAMVARAFLQRG